MHGRVKVKAPKELQAEREQEERALAKKFKEDLDKAWAKRRAKCYDDEALKITARILMLNADYQTIWNFRREIILHMEKESDMEKVYMDELKFSSSCLVKHPKSYATWYHRRCIIIAMKNPPFAEEVQACNQFLDLDERNFHCWDYRRFICNYGKIDHKDEIDFTAKKIGQNFSNFSAFYYRSSILTQSHNGGTLDINDFWDTDYEMISNAIFVDPNDQSPWFYHRWLLAIDKYMDLQNPDPETLLHKIIFDRSNNRIFYQFFRPFREHPFESIIIVTKEGQTISVNDIVWEKNEQSSCDLWYHEIENVTTIDVISFQYSGKQYTVDLPQLDEKSNLQVNVITPLGKEKRCKTGSRLDSAKVDNLKLLQELEPDNKWVNLTLSSFNDKPHEELFTKLAQLDPLRCNYYYDQRSKQIISNRLEDYTSESEFAINGVKLTCLYFANDLTNLRILDLTNNHFSRLSSDFNTLIVLETLILDDNYINYTDGCFSMLTLKKLSLKNNKITDLQVIQPIKNCPSLELVDLTGNPINHEKPSPIPINIKLIF